MKFGIKYYFKATPDSIRSAGDLILAFLGTSGISAIAARHEVLGAVIAGIGFGLKIISNFFVEK
jgi:hypothetical protein